MKLVIQNALPSLFETPDAGFKVGRDAPDVTSDIDATDLFKLSEYMKQGKTHTVALQKTKRNNFVGVTVGRGVDNDVCLNDPKLSKFHGWFYAGHYVDAGSKNGSYINGVKCEPKREYRVQPGDELTLGALVVVVESL